MNRIEVDIIGASLNPMPKFLARLTQRGHLIENMNDLRDILNCAVMSGAPSEALMTLPHGTIKRMNYITVAITGLSTKAVSQLRTHAKRLTFVSTSTQYSDFSGCNDNYVIPDGLSDEAKRVMHDAYNSIQHMYEKLINLGVDKDKASYLLPQGLRKALVISGNLDDWNYVMRTRLCRRNTEEGRYVMKEIKRQIEKGFGKAYTVDMYPNCVKDKCLEGKFCCGRKYTDED